MVDDLFSAPAFPPQFRFQFCDVVTEEFALDVELRSRAGVEIRGVDTWDGG